MPIYEYECTCCPSRFELKRSFTEDMPVCCPECGGEVVRVFSSVPVIFKGSGFYVTDSRANRGHEEGAKESKSDHTEKDS